MDLLKRLNCLPKKLAVCCSVKKSNNTQNVDGSLDNVTVKIQLKFQADTFVSLLEYHRLRFEKYIQFRENCV